MGETHFLKQFHLLCRVSSAKKEALAGGGGNRVEGPLGRQEQLLVGAWSMAAQDLFDLAPHRFDGVEVWRIRWQVRQPGADSFEGFTDSPDFVGGQIVQDHHIARVQSGREPLPHPGQKHFAVHRTFKKPWSAGAVQANAGDQRAGFIASVRDVRLQSLSAQGATPQARHLGVGSAFVHKHQTGRWLDAQVLRPVRPWCGDGGARLFGGGQSFF
jgi:hypothetical protein